MAVIVVNMKVMREISAYFMRKIVLPPCVLPVLIISGCMAPETYFKPSAPGAEYTRITCGGVVGPESRAVLSGPEGIMIGVEKFNLPDGFLISNPDFKTRGIPVSIAFHVPATLESSVRFGSGTFQLTDELTKTVYEYRAKTLLDFGYSNSVLGGYIVALNTIGPRRMDILRLDIRQPLPVTSRKIRKGRTKWFGRELEHLYYILLVFPHADADQFSLRLPPVLVGSTPYQFPDIQFRRVTEWFYSPLNC